MYYSGKIFTYKLDRTTVTVGAPSMLAMSTSPASAGLLFGLSCCRFFSSSSRGWFRPALNDRRLQLDNYSRPLCQSRHKFFYGGGWAAASLSRLSHRLPVAFVPLVYRVGRRNLLQALEIQLSAYTTLQDKYLTTLLKEFTS
jgi:hypothetical protein